MFMVKSRKCHVNAITGHAVPDEVWILGDRHEISNEDGNIVVKDVINAECEPQYFSADEYYVEV